MVKSVSVGVATLLAMVLFAATALAATSSVVVSADGEGAWLFNRDSAAPYEFSSTEASIGSSSLRVLPITNTVGGNSDKFIAELFITGTPVADIDSISYDFLIAGGDAFDAGQFYMNIYTVYPAPGGWYDCRFDYVPGTGSTASFTTFAMAAGDAATSVRTRTVFTPTCPRALAGMPAGSTISFISLNVGDTSGSDLGVGGYYDNVVLTASGGDTTVYDFEAPGPTSKDDCKLGGWEAFGFSNQGLCVSHVASGG